MSDRVKSKGRVFGFFVGLPTMPMNVKHHLSACEVRDILAQNTKAQFRGKHGDANVRGKHESDGKGSLVYA